jgi:uncharacterized protein YndB with AHSA1/START domain
MVGMIFGGLLLGLVTALSILVLILPNKVQYIEKITVDSPVSKVYDAIRYQEQLMVWSAWPSETNSQCFLQGEDGKVGARTVYSKNGKEFGYQEITSLSKNEEIVFRLKSYVAPFEKEVKLTFILIPLPDHDCTEVILWFDEVLKKPHFLIAYFGGIINWVHSMHLKDLQGLKKFVEQK